MAEFNVVPNFLAFMVGFVINDETWTHFNVPDAKEQSKQWIATGNLSALVMAAVLACNRFNGEVSTFQIYFVTLNESIVEIQYNRFLNSIINR